MEQLFQSMPDIIQGLVALVQMLVDSAQGNLFDLHVEEQYGFGVISNHILKLNEALGRVGIASADSLMGAAKALGAIFALIVAAQKAYKMMTLDGKFEVLEIMRPILFAFAITWCGTIVETVTAPGATLESHFRDVYNNKCQVVKELRERRSSISAHFGQALSQKQEAAKQVKENFVTEIWDNIKEAASTVVNMISNFTTFAWSGFLYLFDVLIIFLGETAFQIAAYFVFFIKALFLTVLTLFGPIQLACSILPAWKDAWVNWIGKLVSISLYGAMAYLVMIYSLEILKFAYEVDIENLTKLKEMTTWSNWWDYMCGVLGSTCTVAVAYLCGAVAMSTVPELASWCIPGGAASMGASQFVGGMIGRAERTAKSLPGR